MKKDVVIGLGEIGKPIMQLLEKAIQTEGYDTNPKLNPNQKSMVSTGLKIKCQT